jgi:hypothetical protein
MERQPIFPSVFLWAVENSTTNELRALRDHIREKIQEARLYRNSKASIYFPPSFNGETLRGSGVTTKDLIALLESELYRRPD